MAGKWQFLNFTFVFSPHYPCYTAEGSRGASFWDLWRCLDQKTISKSSPHFQAHNSCLDPLLGCTEAGDFQGRLHHCPQLEVLQREHLAMAATA